MNKIINWQFLSLFVVTLFVFGHWFLLGLISSGDFWFNFPTMFSQFDMFVYAWNWGKGAGLGSPNVLYQAIYLDFGIPFLILGKILRLKWELIERISFFYPFIILSLLSSIYTFKKLFKDNKFWIFSPIVFLFNTYILTVVSGGQIIIGLSYAVTPLVFFFFKNALEENNFKKSAIAGIIFSVQTVLDLRIAYVTAFALILLFAFSINTKDVKESFKKMVYGLAAPFAVAGLLNAFWVLPTLMLGSNPLDQLGGAYNTVGALKFFSFAKFETAISLLHPNWPENIFGKTYFLRPEFLLIPILAFSSLLFIKRDKSSKIILFFCTLALLGTFLAKGSNDPFGFIYVWMFEHTPGFVMFRDPTKWYLLTALSYSILIPFTVYGLVSYLKNSKFRFIQGIIFPAILIYFLFLIKPALFGEIGGTLKTTVLPKDYQKLETFLSSQKGFFRTFWVPDVQRFGYYSSYHPSIPANDFLNILNTDKIVNSIKNPSLIKSLSEGSVKYVIVPYDSHGEIFIKDRKYDEKQYIKAVSELEKIDYLKKVNGFGKIAIFEIAEFKDHFWSNNQSIRINYSYINPSRYSISLANAKKGDILIFTENYDRGWIAFNKSIKYEISSIEYKVSDSLDLNSYILPKDGNYSIEIYYKPQDYVNIGLVISGVSSVSVAILLFRLKK